ncbi:mitochondrial carrier [Amylocystis lapponica]|nr:mitochondrial carrier [Amylocystis lapponica]
MVPIEEEAVEAARKTSTNSAYALKFVGAAFSNMAASAISNPLDICASLPVPGARANAFWSVGLEMARTEGVASLMGGFSASMLREVVYSGIRLGAYEYFKDKIYDASKGALSREGIGLKLAAATISATIGSALANPADLVKVRMQAYYPEGSPYRNMRHAFSAIWGSGAYGTGGVAGGLRALYRGADATTIRGIVLSTSQICSYDQVKQTMKTHGVMQEGIALHFVASMFAGLFCSITSNPVDVVKVRLMNDKAREIKGALDCIKTIMTREGPLAFYKGFGMCWARLGTHTTVTFLIFERVRLLFGIDAM